MLGVIAILSVLLLLLIALNIPTHSLAPAVIGGILKITVLPEVDSLKSSVFFTDVYTNSTTIYNYITGKRESGGSGFSLPVGFAPVAAGVVISADSGRSRRF